MSIIFSLSLDGIANFLMLYFIFASLLMITACFNDTHARIASSETQKVPPPPSPVAIEIYDAKKEKSLSKDEQNRWIDEAQHFLSTIRTLSSAFVQVTTFQNGQSESRDGYVKWLRPAHIKFNYTGAPPLQVVSDGESLYQKDENGKGFPIAIENTPAGLILKNTVDFRKDAIIKKVMETDVFVMITLSSKDDPQGATLTLIFKKKPFALAQWTTIDTAGRITDVILINQEINRPMKKNEFKLD